MQIHMHYILIHLWLYCLIVNSAEKKDRINLLPSTDKRIVLHNMHGWAFK